MPLNKLSALAGQLRKVAALDVASTEKQPVKAPLQKTASKKLDAGHVLNFIKFFHS